jgi:Asp/Glu/hydantoin racemase
MLSLGGFVDYQTHFCSQKITQTIFFYSAEDTLASLIPLHTTLMSSYERGLNQPTLINCLHEALLAALIMINIAQTNSGYGKIEIINACFYPTALRSIRQQTDSTLVNIERQ